MSVHSWVNNWSGLATFFVYHAIRDHCFLVILLNTGLSVSELIDLELSDITMTDRKGEMVVLAGKG